MYDNWNLHGAESGEDSPQVHRGTDYEGMAVIPQRKAVTIEVVMPVTAPDVLSIIMVRIMKAAGPQRPQGCK